MMDVLKRENEILRRALAQYTQASNHAAFGSLAPLGREVGMLRCVASLRPPLCSKIHILHRPHKAIKKDSYACLLPHFPITGFISLALPDICHPQGLEHAVL